MNRTVKLLTGLAAALLAGWLHHGPMGNGERYAGAIESAAKEVVAASEIPGVSVQLGRDPLNRTATLSGAADDFQRNGMGGQKGLTERVAEVPGISSVRWADEGPAGFALPLFAETLLHVALAYLLGLAIGWLVWGRERRQGFA
jgi:hypothetical protein